MQDCQILKYAHVERSAEIWLQKKNWIFILCTNDFTTLGLSTTMGSFLSFILFLISEASLIKVTFTFIQWISFFYFCLHFFKNLFFPLSFFLMFPSFFLSCVPFSFYIIIPSLFLSCVSFILSILCSSLFLYGIMGIPMEQVKSPQPYKPKSRARPRNT